MIHRRSAVLGVVALALAAMSGVACLGSGGGKSPAATATVVATRAAAVSVPATPTPPLIPTLEPTPAPPATYVVKAGDNPTLIAQSLGVPDSEIDDWIAQLLALNNTEATLLQIGQELTLPPFGATAVTTGSSTGPQTAVATTQASSPATGPTQAPVATQAPAATQAIAQNPTATQAAATTPPNQAATATPVAATSTPVAVVATSTPPPGATAKPTATMTSGTIPDPVGDCSLFHSQAVQDWCNHPDGDVLSCSDFPPSATGEPTGEASYFTLTVDYTDINQLDPDGDGRSCSD